MHFPAPTHDTRRGSSRYRGAEGYDAADAIQDRHERERALDAVRASAKRGERGGRGVPSAHQIHSMLSDAVGLALDDPKHAKLMKAVFGPAMKRAIQARGFSLKDPETLRLFDTRLRPSVRLLEYEAQERMEREIAAAAKRRRTTTYAETLAILEDMRDD